MGVGHDDAIQVNFGKAMPLFPLDSAVLLPQQVVPLHIFEPRYRQMVQHALDGAGHIAMAVFEGKAWKQQYHGRPPLRPAVCVGQIVQHERMSDGRYNLLLQGICRARIAEESAPDAERLYRTARLEPVGVEDTAMDASPGELSDIRERLEEMLSHGRLARLTMAEPVLKFVRSSEVTVPALLEIVSFTMLVGPELHYRLLAEESVRTRAGLILGELTHMDELIRRALPQKADDAPKGCHWN